MTSAARTTLAPRQLSTDDDIMKENTFDGAGGGGGCAVLTAENTRYIYIQRTRERERERERNAARHTATSEQRRQAEAAEGGCSADSRASTLPPVLGMLCTRRRRCRHCYMHSFCYITCIGCVHNV
ncbi:unnamed protein product [Trichogramma brassicae]|uniref:Uncharacterized protein n=1 Tax=Trichogramma brassicae TaxID=86971 RepID=A0A6H5IE46_9HYME|nr:unnamed protein product [Trichogramma brassicae]